MLSAWHDELQSQLAGDPLSWIPLLVLFLAYPARIYFRSINASAALLMLSWISMMLYCVHCVKESFSTVTSERPDWFAQNTADYYRLILIPTSIKHAVFTLPFFVIPELRLPGREVRLLLVIAGLAAIDLALLSMLSQHLITSRI